MTTTRPHIYTAVLLLAILAPLALAQDEPTPAATAATNTANEQTAPTPQRLLLPEGTQIQGRRAKLAHAPEDNRWFLIFPELSNQFADPAAVTPPAVANAPATVPTPGATQALDPKHLETSPFATPIEILPGRWLTAMTAIVGNQVDYDVDFRVWGEITTYHDRNYILLTWVGAVSLFGQTLASDAGELVAIGLKRAKFMESCLARAMQAKGWIRPNTGQTQPAAGSSEVHIGATIHAAVRDETGRREVARLDPNTRFVIRREIPTLVRRAVVRVEFDFTHDGNALPGVVEVVRTYDSACDPAVRGQLGLDRADDPDRVPRVKKVVEDLLAQCAHNLKCLISGGEIRAKIRLRPARGEAADRAFVSARGEDWYLAAFYFGAAVDAHPDNAALRFDLAAVSEAGGLLDVAELHYRRAFKLSGEKDQEALDGVHRCRRVYEAREAAKALRTTKK